jgi:hypothetical protein
MLGFHSRTSRCASPFGTMAALMRIYPRGLVCRRLCRRVLKDTTESGKSDKRSGTDAFRRLRECFSEHGAISIFDHPQGYSDADSGRTRRAKNRPPEIGPVGRPVSP